MTNDRAAAFGFNRIPARRTIARRVARAKAELASYERNIGRRKRPG